MEVKREIEPGNEDGKESNQDVSSLYEWTVHTKEIKLYSLPFMILSNLE